MIVNDNRANIEVDGILVESFFNVKQENLAHVFSILRNQLYSNKELAIIREYCTNAFDAHIDADIPDTPIQISVPTYFNSVLTIRDFGFGLSEEDIFNVFASYGESTKRNTNSQVGMMGLGSKSAFSYSDSFTIISYNDGEKKVYSAYIDDSGIGKISKINTEETNENGLEIQIPVNKNDIYRFQNELYSFLKEFNPRPNISNDSDLQRRLDEYIPKIILDGNGWEIRESSYNSNHSCIMGNVMYPVNINNIGFGLEEETVFALRGIQGHFVIHANIGDVKPNAAREMLDYIPMTKVFLQNKFKLILQELKEKSIAKVMDSSSYWEAKINFGTVSKYIPKKESNLEWNGLLVNSDFIKIENPITIYRKFNDNKWTVHSVIQADKNATIFIYKGDVSKKSIFIRAQTYIYNNEIDTKKVYLLGFDNVESANTWLDLGYLNGAKTIDVSSIPYVFRKKDRAIQVNEKAEIYRFNPIKQYGFKNKEYWIAENSSILEEDMGCYIPIKYFAPTQCNISKEKFNDECLSLLSHFYNTLNNYGIEPPVLYGIPIKTIEDLPSAWISFDEYVQGALNALSDKAKNDLIYTSNYTEISSFWISIAKELGEDDQTGFYDEFKQWFDSQIMHRTNLYDLSRYGFQFDQSSAKQSKQKKEELIEKYPLLKAFDSRPHPELVSEIAKYIKSV